MSCNRAGIRRPAVYVGLGLLLWLAVSSSGVHATVAGVLLAMTIPARTRINEDQFIDRADAAIQEFERASGPEITVLSNPRQQEALHELTDAITDAQAPLMRMEHALHGVIAFAIMPLFALANAGVDLRGGVLGNLHWGIVGGIMLGLLIGKSMGITAASWIATRTGLAAPMTNVGWKAVHGVGWLGGIGFTMSLFVASLAFGQGPLMDSAKVGILAGSVLAGIVGWILLRVEPPPGAGQPDATVMPFPVSTSWPRPPELRS
jgi:NhaA family Na+:H+ antiporter